MSETLDKPTDIATYRMEATKRTVNDRLREENAAFKTIIATLVKNTEAATKNEEITRGRFEAFYSMGFRDRLRWLIRGIDAWK